MRSRSPRPRRGKIIDDKEFLLALDPEKFFTEPHYNGFPAILVRLPAVTVRELKPLLTEAWRCQAPKGLEPKPPTPRHRSTKPTRRRKA